ncbi:hypothetical protein QQS21_008258 [Conoideocrella luteorostrata]|uniref:Zn(2)-C6 fungal-type domain-containing protein n=1 Tax=Conoideocrella luteorostrata TaxID=1105319 RepID=A0AAJ0CJC8_9HYPO|nr:hypothetical protein QQS21_008258 [Conoideocrella luteorostrata]
MVNRGRSQGCTTCRQRRVKCDEAKPECGACQRLGLYCGGYKTRPVNIRFKDQTVRFSNVIAARETEAIPRPRQLKSLDNAVNFYLDHYVNVGRRMESARGFFEVLIPVYSAERQNSALSLAVSAVASEILNLWRYGPASLSSSCEPYSKAVMALRGAIQDPVQQTKPATVLAILTMQWYENIAAIFGHRSATPTHHAGALSLLPFMESDNGSKDQTTVASIRRFIAHAEVSSATRQKRPVNDAILSCISRGGLLSAPQNPSASLDAIGATVAALRARYAQNLSALSDTLGDLAAEAKAIDQQLLTWSWSVPEHWKPRKITSGQDFDLSIPAYRSTCEVYPSSQIANIWNMWRVHRILLFKIVFESLHREPQVENLVGYEQIFQELVDAICYSVPFYLGNRVRPMHITDFDDCSISLCGHSIPSQDSQGRSPQSPTSTRMSEDEHRRQVVAQGPWHLMNPLSRLLTLLAEDDNHHLTGILRSGQHKWIRQQFQRVTTLLRLSPPDQHSAGKSTTLNSPDPASLNTTADDLAGLVRRGGMFMSGP